MDWMRRANMETMSPAELAILKAMEAVEAMPADDRLTDAVVLLGAAKDSVADYIDGRQLRRSVEMRIWAAPTPEKPKEK